MSWNAFGQSMLLLIMASFLVERSLAVIFETRFYILKFGANRQLKPLIAIFYATAFVAVIDINLAEVIRQAGDENADYSYTWTGDYVDQIRNVLVVILTGIFIAGGSKASLKLFRDVWDIKSSEEATRNQSITAVPADPVQAAGAAANGNTQAENMLYNMFDASGVAKAK